MSNWGESTRRITNNEYDRLSNAANRVGSLSSQIDSLSNLNEILRENIDSLSERLNDNAKERRRIREEIQAANAKNDAKHGALRVELQNAIAATDARIEAARKETVRAMDDMRGEMHRSIAATNERIDSVRNETMRAMNDMRDDFTNTIESNNRRIEAAMNRNNQILNGRIDALRRETNAAIAANTTAINNIVAADNDLLGQAQEYREQTQVVQGMIEATRHQLLIPGGYQNVLDSVKQAERDIALADTNHANSPVARNNARMAFEEASRFYEEVCIAENEWQMRLSEAEQLAAVVEAQLDNSRTIEPKPGKEFDVDYWTYGDLASHEETLEGLRDQVDDPAELSKDDLINIQSALRNVSENIEHTHRDAYIAIATSQNVVEDAEKLRAELSAEGSFSVESHAYEGDDERGNYRYILRNPAGLTVVVTINVNREEDVEIQTIADIVDYGTVDMHDAEDMVNSVLERLSGKTPDTWHREGVQCHNRGGVVCHPERADMNTWQHSQTQKPNRKPSNANNSGRKPTTVATN